MKNLSMFILSFLLLTACSSKHIIKYDETSYNEVNQRFEDGDGTVILNSGEEISGSIGFVNSELISVDGINIPTSKIDKIISTNNSMGISNGALIGAISGAGLGLIIGHFNSIDYYTKYHGVSKYDIGLRYTPEMSWSAESGEKGAIIGCVIGLVVGAIIGEMNRPTDTFVFSQAETNDTTYGLTANKEIIPLFRVKISSIVEETSEYIIISRQEKQIRLLKSEYNSIEVTDEGKQFIIVPEEVYLEKF